MKLNAKVLITYAIVGTILLAAIGWYAAVTLRDARFRSISESFFVQLHHVGFAVTSFLKEVEYDVLTLVANEAVRTRDDATFTSFLEAEEETFEYHYGPAELAIIEVFDSYRTSHPYANSVYMGRENGSFVRSHPRARPTQYDPRQRPWYQLAASNPHEVMRTAPYPSVTTADVNIGTVKALVDEGGQTYGVVGVDVTLRSLTDFMSTVEIGDGSTIVLLDDSGIILTGQDEAVRARRYDDAGLDYYQAVMDNGEGYITFDGGDQEMYLFYQTSPELGWKISAIVPTQQVDREAWDAALRVVGLLALSLLLLSILTVLGMHRFVVWPIGKLDRSVQAIVRTRDLDTPIAVDSADEIGQLAASFNEMVRSIRRAGSDLAASEEKYRSLVANVNVGVFRTTFSGRLLHANRAAFHMLGYIKPEESVEFRLRGLFADDQDRERMVEELLRHGSLTNHELRLVKRDGNTIWVALTVTGQRGPDGSIEVLDGVVEDISARREAEEVLRQAHDELEKRVAERTADLEARNAELDAFAHTVAHDLKNPAAILAGYAELLQEDHASLPPVVTRKAFQTLSWNARKIITIVDEILLLASVRAMGEVETQPLEMGEIVAEALGRLNYLIDEVGGEIVLPPQWPQAQGYAPWIEEVWMNYISNALTYGARPPKVELGADPPLWQPVPPAGMQRMIRFWVRDNGPGLSPEQQASLFTPFERLHQLRIKGHGLGLSIVQRIVQRLGGEVGVESPAHTGPGQDTNPGCTFYFTLPASQPQAIAGNEAEAGSGG
jgi:PAS domain S-box-containing protein